MAENATESGAAAPAPATSSPSPAPGAPANEATGESATGTSQSRKQAGDGQQKDQGRTMFEGMLPMILIFVAVFYFVLWRPQSRQRKERASMLEALKKGDRVVTMGGVLGQIVEMNEHEITLRVDTRKDVQLKFQRSAVLHIATKGAANPPEQAPS